MEKLRKRGAEKLREVINWLHDLWLKSLSDKEVQDNYVDAGAELGDALSYGYLGEPLGLDGMVSNWARWELEYSKRGYRTISLEDLIDYGGYGRLYAEPLKGLGVKREPKEQIILYSILYR